MEYADSIIHRLRFALAGIAIILGVILLYAFYLAATEGGSRFRQTNTRSEVLLLPASDSPNNVTSGLITLVNESSDFVYSVKDTGIILVHAIGDALQRSGKLFASVGAFIGHASYEGARFAVRVIGSWIGFMANMLTNVAVFIIRIPNNLVEAASNTAAVSAVIRPAEHAEIPIIDPNSPELKEAQIAMTTSSESIPNTDSTPQWPINGAVTTKFGVKHWPYQPTHTGIDISDGQRSGVTDVRPFKPGKVIEVSYSNNGLGNYVVIDHGSGVTSVYAHLASILVKPGQEVDKSTTVGREGSTGVSTGTHLHFEIRVNGMAADPQQFITGLP